MARAPKSQANPVGDFMKNAPNIWKTTIYTALNLYARLASDVALKAMQEKTSEITNGSKFMEVSGSSSMIQIVDDTIGFAIGGRDRMSRDLRMRKDGGGYRFNLRYRDKAVIKFSEVTLSLPGSIDIINHNAAATDAEIFAPIIAGLREIGFDIKSPKLNEPFDVKFSYGDGEAIYLPPQRSENIGTILSATLPKDFKFSQPSHKIEMGATIYISSEIPGMREITIDPYMDIVVNSEVFNALSESDAADAKTFLGFEWMKKAVHSGLFKSTEPWTGQPFTDLRMTSKQLQDVVRQHGRATPRVNKDDIAISEQGIPVYIPQVDVCESYMRDMGKPVVTDEGFISFDNALEGWSNKIVLTDWFNDILVYTKEDGSLKTYRMHGFVELDTNSEYVFMNTPLVDSYVNGMLSLAQSIASSGILDYETVTKFLPPAMRTPESYNGGKITTGFADILMRLRNNTIGKLSNNDPSYIRDNPWSLTIKHLLGQDVDEVPEALRPLCFHSLAYLKALNSVRKKIEAPVMSRMLGFEWLIISAGHIETRYPVLREESIKLRSTFKQAPLLDKLDIPNTDAGGNLVGVLPHQLKILSNRATGVSSASIAASAGGGKTLMILADILMKKMDNPTWKPFILTKGRLVKGFISEINYFTKGKVNTIFLSTREINTLRKKLKINTAEKFLKYLRSLPSNTIFLSSYSSIRTKKVFFKDLNVPSRVFDQKIGLPQIIHLLRLIGFEMVRCDESHMIKNQKTDQAKMSYTMLAQSKEKVIASGTQTHNTVIDMLGQGFGLNPMIYGNSLEGFKKRYDVASGIIGLEDAQKMKRRMNRFIQENVASKEDWAFLLPDLVDKSLTANMTALQSMFYNLLLQRATVQLKAKLNGEEVPDEFKDPVFEPKPKDTIDGEKPEDGEEEDDEEEDDEEEDEGEDLTDEDDEDALFLHQLDRSLQKVEAFIAAPDENEEYLRLNPSPGPDDLVSPFVPLVDSYLDKIYANGDGDHTNNKTAIFGINKVASKHFIKHSRWANRSLWYTAGNEEIIRRFKTEPNVWILVADSTSLREGENLQMLSQIFELQCMWAPGDFEQLVSRMYRPDPKGTYSKDKVYHYWCTARKQGDLPDINTIKLARMASKAISLAQYQYSDDPRWKRVANRYEDLDMIRMSFDFIEGARMVDLQPYLEAWSDFVDWQTSLNQQNRSKFAEELEAVNPGITLLDPTGRVIDRKLFTSLAMKPVVSTKNIPGSKKAYTPWTYGATPADPYNMGLAILGNQPIAIGDYVMTEFGPGIIQGSTSLRCSVELFNLKKIRLAKQCIAIPLDPKGKETLRDIIRNPSAWRSESFTDYTEALPKLDPSTSLAPKGSIRTSIPAKPSTSVNPTPVVTPPKTPTKPANILPEPVIKPKSPAEELPVVEEIYTYLVNGYPALAVMDPPDKLLQMTGWSMVPDFITVTFRDWKTAQQLITGLADKFYMSKANYDKLLEEMQEFQTGKAMRLNKAVRDSQVRNFFLSEMKGPSQVKGEDVVHPYWLSVDRDIFLAFSKRSHSAAVLRWLKNIQSKNAGKIKAVTTNDGFAINVFNNLNEAAEEIKALGKVFDIPAADIRNELREMREDIQELKMPMRTPGRARKVEEEPVKPTPKPTPPKAPVKPATKPTVKPKVKPKTTPKVKPKIKPRTTRR